MSENLNSQRSSRLIKSITNMAAVKALAIIKAYLDNLTQRLSSDDLDQTNVTAITELIREVATTTADSMITTTAEVEILHTMLDQLNLNSSRRMFQIGMTTTGQSQKQPEINDDLSDRTDQILRSLFGSELITAFYSNTEALNELLQPSPANTTP